MALPDRKTALITGITGQDGSYLAELLLKKDYNVVGLTRRNSQSALGHASHLVEDVTLVTGDITDGSSIMNILYQIKPDEIFNLAAQSHVGASFHQPFSTNDMTGVGPLRLYDAVRQLQSVKRMKIYQASSSEMFGRPNPEDIPQNELTQLRPANPYAVSKVFAHNMARVYRDSYDIPISCGILFNHESPRRGKDFVTQKVAYAAACASKRIETSERLNERGIPVVNKGKLTLGTFEAERDWGFAGDYVVAMWLMLQHEPDDFIVATGKKHTIRDLCKVAYDTVDLNYEEHVEIDARLARPSETGPLLGNAEKAKTKLGWEPTTTFEELIKTMVFANLGELG